MTLSTIGDQFNEMQPILNITNTEQTVSAQNLFSRENLGKLSKLKKDQHNSVGREKISYCSSYKTCLEFCLFR